MDRQYIAGSVAYNRIEKHVNAPLFRRRFNFGGGETARIEISAAGLYRLFLNGRELTKGYLAPYISNPEHIVYYDEYDVSGDLKPEGNELYVLLGNGFNNANDNGLWDFDKAGFRSAPKFYLALYSDGGRVLTTDENFEVADSPITFDDIRCGERFDARLEENLKKEAAWRKPLLVPAPKGEYRKCNAQPVKAFERIRPKSIVKSSAGYLYDFGEINAGACLLRIDGKSGQEIDLTYGEAVGGGELDLRNISFGDRSPAGYVQHDKYICKDGKQEYFPSFTYHGFRYVCVEGVSEAQATEELLEFVVVHSDIPPRGSFRCSDETVNRIQECTLRSDLSNFHCFPTDCPQREKNGWTADASLSAEQLLYNFDCAASLKEWLNNIRRAQTAEGALPGIVPTAGWGYAWGNGPAWDSVLTELPFQIYRFTGDKGAIEDNADAIVRYFGYLKGKRNERGLLAFGLGDWCEAGTYNEDGYSTPLEVTDTLVSIDLAAKAAALLREIGREKDADGIFSFGQDLKAAFRRKYVENGELVCKTQTALAMALGIGVFGQGERAAAERALLAAIDEADGHFKVGVIGGKYLFDALTDCGRPSLAYKLITQPSFPSYAYNLSLGATTLWEAFQEYESDTPKITRKDGGERILSFNHHFWGSVSAWFYRALGGLKILSAGRAEISPEFIPELGFAEAKYEEGDTHVFVHWERRAEKIVLTVSASGFEGFVRLKGYAADEGGEFTIKEGVTEYVLHRI